MSSSQPVTTPQALNFTPDNKHAYAYSGITAVTNSLVTIMEFTTQSYYVVASFQAQYFSDNNDVYLHTVKFNDTEVIGFEFNGSNNADGAIKRPLLIPPFTKVTCTAKNTTDSTSNNIGVAIIGECFGTPNTEGYQ